jgi:ABC-2 type transport system ATP-binding protein/lipopolysaccharide transport system ATP-binding protein
MSAIVVEGVSKRFRLQTDKAHSVKELITRRDRSADEQHFWALKDVSLEIPEGSMYALVGHNGSGKSTLLRCIAGIYQPSEGSVSAAGRMSTLLELGAGFHPDLTGRENVYMNATILGMGKKQIDASFDKIVEFAGVEDFIDSPVKIYSSGMYVRLGFSVAVHVDPEILIVDEVIAVGDAEFQRKCFDHLFELRRKGTTIVVVTHGLGTVQSMCDGAAWLDHGVLQMTGTGSEVAAAYLQQVNEAERRERDLAEAAVEEEPTAPSGAPAPRRAEDVRIDRVEFVGADGVPSNFAIHREPLTIRVRYDAVRPVDRPVVGLAIHSASDVHLTGTNTKIDGYQIDRVQGEGYVDFYMDQLHLTPGEYEVTVAISDEFVQHNFDRRDREFRLSVREGTHQAPEGLTDLLGEWSNHQSD